MPHISITTTFGLVLIDSAVLIYFIHHITIQIQLPQVIASIAKDLAHAVEVQSTNSPRSAKALPADVPSLDELIATIDNSGSVIRTPEKRLPSVHPAQGIGPDRGAGRCRHPPALPARAFSGRGARAGQGMATGSGRSGGSIPGTRTSDRTSPDTHPGRGLWRRSARRDSYPGLIGGGERRFYRADVYRLARGLPMQNRESMESYSGSSRP